MKKYQKISLWILLILFGIIIIFYMTKISSQAVVSVQSVCFPEIKEQRGIVDFAETIKYSNGTITVTYFVEPDEKIIKHEFCHVNQNRRFLTFRSGCSGLNLMGKFLRELECYNSENIPNKIYNFLYRND